MLQQKYLKRAEVHGPPPQNWGGEGITPYIRIGLHWNPYPCPQSLQLCIRIVQIKETLQQAKHNFKDRLGKSVFFGVRTGKVLRVYKKLMKTISTKFGLSRTTSKVVLRTSRGRLGSGLGSWGRFGDVLEI